MYHTESFKADAFVPARFESGGEIVLRGQRIPYRTVSEDNVFYNEEGKPIATVFSYAYLRSDVADTSGRPVVFGFNGGPGSSSKYVHAGFLGPRRLSYGAPDRPTALPPYDVIENPDCLLDVADLVLVDPVGTGYGALLDPGCEKLFYGIEEDAEALLAFVEQWLTRHDRWLSPKYLLGESYGCTRAATAAGIAARSGKDRCYGVVFDGVIMIGNTVSTGQYYNKAVPAEPAVQGFPTYAAVNWYHNRPSNQTVEEFVAEARAFADTEYVLALYQGRRLTDAEREHIIERVCYYTGVSREYLLARDLRVEDGSFRSEVLKSSGRAVSRYDGRMTRPLYEPREVEDKIGWRDDATGDRYDGYFYGALTGAILPALGVKLPREYVSSAVVYQKWNLNAPAGSTGEQLRRAMHARPGMRTFFANGWFDLCTETGLLYYMLDHAHLPMDRVYFRGYPSGHMIYIGEENIRALSNDVRSFLLKDPAFHSIAEEEAAR